MNINYDQLFSIDTSNKGVRKDQLEQYYQYEATPYPHLKTLFSAYPLKPTDHLVDIGAGKGRLLFYAHYYFSCHVTGIELNKQLYHLAYENKTRYFKTFPNNERSIRIIHDRAENYSIQMKDNIFYLFNPFSIHIFKKIIDNINASVQQQSRTITLILYYPAHEYEHFLQTDTLFKLIKTVKIPGISKINPKECFVIYQLAQ